ncbi:hypothetical protein QTN25_001878 [Entamoeba marina]
MCCKDKHVVINTFVPPLIPLWHTRNAQHNIQSPIYSTVKDNSHTLITNIDTLYVENYDFDIDTTYHNLINTLDPYSSPLVEEQSDTTSSLITSDINDVGSSNVSDEDNISTSHEDITQTLDEPTNEHISEKEFTEEDSDALQFEQEKESIQTQNQLRHRTDTIPFENDSVIEHHDNGNENLKIKGNSDDEFVTHSSESEGVIDEIIPNDEEMKNGGTTDIIDILGHYNTTKEPKEIRDTKKKLSKKDIRKKKTKKKQPEQRTEEDKKIKKNLPPQHQINKHSVDTSETKRPPKKSKKPYSKKKESFNIEVIMGIFFMITFMLGVVGTSLMVWSVVLFDME